MKQGLLLFAHGAREPRWTSPFEDIAQRIRTQQPDVALELAYLEFMSPNMAEAGQRLAAAGCRRVAILPLFLGAGGHVLKDLPALIADLEKMHRTVQWRRLPIIGEVDSVLAAMTSAAVNMLTQTSQ